MFFQENQGIEALVDSLEHLEPEAANDIAWAFRGMVELARGDEERINKLRQLRSES